jgi:hypothetical protein
VSLKKEKKDYHTLLLLLGDLYRHPIFLEMTCFNIKLQRSLAQPKLERLIF